MITEYERELHIERIRVLKNYIKIKIKQKYFLQSKVDLINSEINKFEIAIQNHIKELEKNKEN